MKVVVGLGNPGGEYEQSRHNMGFMVISRLAERLGG
ncbi:MAG: aminoacyl-tRNA hydrolase, partial [Deltaproteobacteria bacterium]|nr:aminoacyl-tRNA hydrolase [Deltaproteobacteria bacterium]